MTCTETECLCACQLDEGHIGFHHCECGGEWTWLDGHFVVNKYPPTTGGNDYGEGVPYEDVDPVQFLLTALGFQE